MNDLRPCPFCGESSLRRNKPNNFMPEYICCDTCGGTNGASVWNTRASDEVIRGLVEALEICKERFDFYRSVRGDDGALKPAVDATEKALAQAREYLGE